MMFRSVYIAGHKGLVGSALLRNLQKNGYRNILVRTRQELDLRQSDDVHNFFSQARPEAVVVAAAKVGGIKANSEYPVDFLLENLQIQNNLIAASFESGVKKLLFLGSSCVYPKLAPQPIREESLLAGPLESTNEPYAIAKIAGIKLCQAYAKQYGRNFVCAMPTNIYGPGDNFDLDKSHVLAALIRKVHEAKSSNRHVVAIWGTGTPRREFLHADDLADALRFLLENYDSPEIINVGCGEDLTIRELVEIVAKVIGFEIELEFDTTKPDGTPQKLLDTSRLLALGWKPRISLHDGIRQTYQWLLESSAQLRGWGN
ncbi:MAG: GDP-L-fucose synthase [Verrucomicrobia bacterium]|nr:GDP-L-fucose synthase [Verrucomicrobiota bacterium]